MKHKHKKTLARRISRLVHGMFTSVQWEKRKEAIALRTKKREMKTKELALLKKQKHD